MYVEPEPAQLLLEARQLLMNAAGPPQPSGRDWNVRDPDGRAVHITLRTFGVSQAVFFESAPAREDRGPCTWWVPLLNDSSIRRLQSELRGLRAPGRDASA